ncbi:MAG: terpene cyclase/mutase family protein [Gemmataceae bacterium]|nr:terpene cyclase/mutase family protein [Gemmataceae bacterium]
MSRSAGLVVVLLAGCSPPPGPDPPPPAARTPADALAGGVKYLLDRQSPDGTWRSDVYATFKDGPALTPLVVVALQAAGDPASAAARRKGSEYLAGLIRPDGTTAADIDYPAYTAALGVTALSHPDNKDLRPARDRWLKFLLDRQLTERLGWSPEDKEYGGWGYCRVVPKKPTPGALAPPLVESNLSATVYALDALRAAGVADREVYDKALVFVRRCQNPDGGFHFVYDDPVRNKAGSPDLTAKPVRFHSYGSTTADGLRALRLAGEPDAARIEQARAWLATHFRADRHPGDYVPAHEPNRDAVYYYYAASLARSLRGWDPFSGRSWQQELSGALVERQAVDGSWANPVELVRENDQLVATSQAVIALSAATSAAR